VEIALESAALGVPRFNDAGARGAQILELRVHLGLETLILEREAGRRCDFFDELRIVQKAGSVYEDGHGPTVANERRRDTTLQPG
jgi:hypothetical protein